MTLNLDLESVCYMPKYRFRVVESLSTYQINRILSLSKESNTMDPKVTKAIGIKVIVAFCRLFHCRNSLLFDQTRQVLVQGLIGKFRSALPSILGGIGAQFVQSAAY
jgi:hypothetical protein